MYYCIYLYIYLVERLNNWVEEAQIKLRPGDSGIILSSDRIRQFLYFIRLIFQTFF